MKTMLRIQELREAKIILPKEGIVQTYMDLQKHPCYKVDVTGLREEDIIYVQYDSFLCEVPVGQLKSALNHCPTEELTSEYLPTFVYYYADGNKMEKCLA